jgi:Domain of unknown function (DUF4157)
VYFNSGKYNPSNTEGSRLLAHELTHTVQQKRDIKANAQTKLIQLADKCNNDPPRIPHHLLIKGSVHSDVREVQRKLVIFNDNEIKAGKPPLISMPLADDCIFGQATFNAVLEFQKRVFPNRRDQWDGIVGNNTWAEIDKVNVTPTVIAGDWKISGNTATALRNAAILGDLAVKVGGKFNDWKCIKPLKMAALDNSTVTESQQDNYAALVQTDDMFDVSNLTAQSGTETQMYLFDDTAQKSDADVAKKFYPGSRSKDNPDDEMAFRSKHGGTPLSHVMILGHAGGSRMFGRNALFRPSDFMAEEPAPTYLLAKIGFFPRRCWFTKNATARLVGCASQSIAQDFANAYLRDGASVITTTASISTVCTKKIDFSGNCTEPDALMFVEGIRNLSPPFTTRSAFEGSSFWNTLKGGL